MHILQKIKHFHYTKHLIKSPGIIFQIRKEIKRSPENWVTAENARSEIKGGGFNCFAKKKKKMGTKI